MSISADDIELAISHPEPVAIQKNPLDLLLQQTCYPERERKARIVLAGLDGVDGLPRHFELLGNSPAAT